MNGVYNHEERASIIISLHQLRLQLDMGVFELLRAPICSNAMEICTGMCKTLADDMVLII